MKFAPLIPLIGAMLCVASPATACRIAWSSSGAKPVAFTATVDLREETVGMGGDTVSITLRIRRRISGPAPDMVTAGASEEVVVAHCYPKADYDGELMEARAGDELVVTGWDRNGALLIIDLGRLNTARGRALLATAEAGPARP